MKRLLIAAPLALLLVLLAAPVVFAIEPEPAHTIFLPALRADGDPNASADQESAVNADEQIGEPSQPVTPTPQPDPTATPTPQPTDDGKVRDGVEISKTQQIAKPTPIILDELSKVDHDADSQSDSPCPEGKLSCEVYLPGGVLVICIKVGDWDCSTLNEETIDKLVLPAPPDSTTADSPCPEGKLSCEIFLPGGVLIICIKLGEWDCSTLNEPDPTKLIVREPDGDDEQVDRMLQEGYAVFDPSIEIREVFSADPPEPQAYQKVYDFGSFILVCDYDDDTDELLGCDMYANTGGEDEE